MPVGKELYRPRPSWRHVYVTYGAPLPTTNFRPMSIAAKRSQISATAEHFYSSITFFDFFINDLGGNAYTRGTMFFPKKLADTTLILVTPVTYTFSMCSAIA